MESVADSTVIAVSAQEETLMEQIEEMEEQCNVFGSRLNAYNADGLSDIYPFMSLHL